MITFSQGGGGGGGGQQKSNLSSFQSLAPGLVFPKEFLALVCDVSATKTNRHAKELLKFYTQIGKER